MGLAAVVKAVEGKRYCSPERTFYRGQGKSESFWAVECHDGTAYEVMICGLVTDRNTLHWFKGGLGGEPGIGSPMLQFELNGLWFDTSFHVWRH